MERDVNAREEVPHALTRILPESTQCLSNTLCDAFNNPSNMNNGRTLDYITNQKNQHMNIVITSFYNEAYVKYAQEKNVYNKKKTRDFRFDKMVNDLCALRNISSTAKVAKT